MAMSTPASLLNSSKSERDRTLDYPEILDIMDILEGKPMREFSTADLNKQVGNITDAAMREPVLITHHRRPRFVLMSIDEFNKLSKARPDDVRTAFTLDTMPTEIEDGILALADQYERDPGHDG